MSRTPPRKLSAFPRDATVTSMVCPCFAKGGSVAVTMTAATFLDRIWTFGGRLVPSCLSMFDRLWAVNFAPLVLSPVPSSPTTKP
jgi:hypothetical protein